MASKIQRKQVQKSSILHLRIDRHPSSHPSLRYTYECGEGGKLGVARCKFGRVLFCSTDGLERRDGEKESEGGRRTNERGLKAFFRGEKYCQRRRRKRSGKVGEREREKERKKKQMHPALYVRGVCCVYMYVCVYVCRSTLTSHCLFFLSFFLSFLRPSSLAVFWVFFFSSGITKKGSQASKVFSSCEFFLLPFVDFCFFLLFSFPVVVFLSVAVAAFRDEREKVHLLLLSESLH